MTERERGKLIWTDGASGHAGVWRTALLLMTIIFVMNLIRLFVVSEHVNLLEVAIYLVLAVIGAITYVYFSLEPDRMSFRARVYENGILASAYTKDGGISTSKEVFFDWGGIGDIKAVEARFSKKNWVNITHGGREYSMRVQDRGAFMSLCDKKRM